MEKKNIHNFSILRTKESGNYTNGSQGEKK